MGKGLVVCNWICGSGSRFERKGKSVVKPFAQLTATFLSCI